MPRKRWSPQTEITPALLKFREKRKWQISFRRYVIQRTPCPAYAPYFGLDIENLRKWFEIQLEGWASWEDFGKTWQFAHIIPVTYFDFADPEDLKLCWNFINIRAEQMQTGDRALQLDLLGARQYFNDLYAKTSYAPCLRLSEKIVRIGASNGLGSEKQLAFMQENRAYLAQLERFSTLEFELLNSGKSIADIQKEVAFQKRFE